MIDTTEEMFLKLSEQIAEVIRIQDQQGKQINSLIDKVDNIEKGQNDLRHKVDNLEKDVTAIKIDIENHVEPMLCELSGRVVDSSQRIMMIESKAEAYDDEKEIDKVIAEIKQKGMM